MLRSDKHNSMTKNLSPLVGAAWSNGLAGDLEPGGLWLKPQLRKKRRPFIVFEFAGLDCYYYSNKYEKNFKFTFLTTNILAKDHLLSRTQKNYQDIKSLLN